VRSWPASKPVRTSVIGEGQLIRNIFPSAGIWINVSITGLPITDWIASALPCIYPTYLSLMWPMGVNRTVKCVLPRHIGDSSESFGGDTSRGVTAFGWGPGAVAKNDG
jgi:hypothetical protein